MSSCHVSLNQLAITYQYSIHPLSLHLLIQLPLDAVPANCVFPSLGHAAQYVLLTQYVFLGHWLQGGMPSVENVPATHMAENIKWKAHNESHCSPEQAFLFCMAQSFYFLNWDRLCGGYNISIFHTLSLHVWVFSHKYPYFLSNSIKVHYKWCKLVSSLFHWIFHIKLY